MIIVAWIVIGFIAGYGANAVVGKGKGFQPYELVVAGLVGSLVGGTLFSLLLGEGFDLRIGGLLGSFVGAIIVLLVYRPLRGRFAR
ncbi:MAG: GlsB/YeaQ/YmgE family stress response membrane protein [Chloroflexota bacterium]